MLTTTLWCLVPKLSNPSSGIGLDTKWPVVSILQQPVNSTVLEQGFSTTYIWAFCLGACPVLYGMFSSVPSLSPLAASRTLPLHQLWQQKLSPNLQNCSRLRATVREKECKHLVFHYINQSHRKQKNVEFGSRKCGPNESWCMCMFSRKKLRVILAKVLVIIT